MPRRIDVFLVAPQMLCWGFERVVENACDDVRVVGSAPHIDQAASHLRRVPADVVVVDYDEVLEADALRAANLSQPVVLLAPEREKQHIGHWTRAGVMAVLPKDTTASLLSFAIRSACDWGCPQAGVAGIQLDERALDEATEDAQERSKLQSLTLRERQLLFAVVCNSTTPGKVLADQLCISEHTLRNHLTSVYGKLGVQNRLGLHDFAQRSAMRPAASRPAVREIAR